MNKLSAVGAQRSAFSYQLSAVVFVLAASGFLADSAAAETWKAGAARVKITPDEPMWMSGYAGRDKPAQGTLTELWAKALVLEDAGGRRAAIVSLDLVGIARDFYVKVRQRIESEHGLEPRQVALFCSHTHTGPVVGHNLGSMYFLSAEEQSKVERYTDSLADKIVAVVGQALAGVAPCELSWGTGYTSFAVNRRENVEANVPQLRTEGRLKGPVDYDVPVLAVRNAERQIVAIAFGYACHATVLSSFEWSGDYPGFAQIELEQSHPEAVALFWAGCGADQNPLPRRTPELAETYGKRLAAAVDEVLGGAMRPVAGELTTAFREVDLPFDTLPTREQLETDKSSNDRYVARRAELLLAQIDSGRPLSQTYPYPVQVWRLGSDLTWITLGGEVVVDFSLRLKQELPPGRTWVAGYANDVMAYIPSRRVLAEGGYEGSGAMVYYGQPTNWGPTVEEDIVEAVHGLASDGSTSGAATP